MKKTSYVIIALVILVALIGGSYLLFGRPKGEEQEKKDEVKISNTDIENKLYPLLKSSSKSRIYKKDKVTAEKVSNEQIILGTITYVILNHENELNKKDNGYEISFETIEKYALKLYGKKIDVKNAKVDTLFNIHSQTSFVTADKKSEIYKFNFDFLEDDAKPKDLLTEYHDMDVIYNKVEVDKDTVTLYDKVIVNSDFDFSNEIATISKLDGSAKKELDKFGTIKDVNQKYPEYFTEFKHTFKINEDKTYTYVSSEPIV